MYKFIKEPNKASVAYDEILDLENRWNLTLPSELKEYYREYDGSKIYVCLLSVDGYDHEISNILPIKNGKYLLEQAIKNDRDDSIIPVEYIPIANNRGGDYIYWNSEDNGIYMIYCDDIENPIYICDGISEIFNMMDRYVDSLK